MRFHKSISVYMMPFVTEIEMMKQLVSNPDIFAQKLKVFNGPPQFRHHTQGHRQGGGGGGDLFTPKFWGKKIKGRILTLEMPVDAKTFVLNLAM